MKTVINIAGLISAFGGAMLLMEQLWIPIVLLIGGAIAVKYKN